MSDTRGKLQSVPNIPMITKYAILEHPTVIWILEKCRFQPPKLVNFIRKCRLSHNLEVCKPSIEISADVV